MDTAGIITSNREDSPSPYQVHKRKTQMKPRLLLKQEKQEKQEKKEKQEKQEKYEVNTNGKIWKK